MYTFYSNLIRCEFCFEKLKLDLIQKKINLNLSHLSQSGLTTHRVRPFAISNPWINCHKDSRVGKDKIFRCLGLNLSYYLFVDFLSK